MTRRPRGAVCYSGAAAATPQAQPYGELCVTRACLVHLIPYLPDICTDHIGPFRIRPSSTDAGQQILMTHKQVPDTGGGKLRCIMRTLCTKVRLPHILVAIFWPPHLAAFPRNRGTQQQDLRTGSDHTGGGYLGQYGTGYFSPNSALTIGPSGSARPSITLK